ncbi:hypothetical protein HYFRA_00001240 [Hymenoscyphus fraxineus]|uniref:F-box domain-containing protein n=1 Tax=Hymenoscyphus fraxineus TaxID=746836 RepID=A0A9N9PRI3_9HELO|nr:hypothetical protein HYFRA_00001240 [Hymenoscyphus fraxineus]
MASRIGINSLPNEILHTILSTFTTRTILPLTSVSHRFHALILRILKSRLLHAASHPNHKLILECYHPSAKFYTPYLFCEYLSTPGLSLSPNNPNTSTTHPPNHQTKPQEQGELANLSSLHSYFRPIKPLFPRRKAPSSYPAGLAGDEWPTPQPLGLSDRHERFVCQDVHLESNELFSQLVTSVNLVKIEPKSGGFVCSAPVGDGLVRVWRRWLGDAETEGEVGFGGFEGEVEGRERGILWGDSKEDIGLVMGVEQIPVPELQQPQTGAGTTVGVGIGEREDPPVSYTLRYEGLAIRTVRILLQLEDALGREVGEGKAILVAWRR